MLTYLIKGGPLMIAIGLCSIVAGTVTVMQWLRIWQASQDRSKALSEIEQAVRKRDWTRALQISDKYQHPFLKPWRIGFFLLIEGKSDLRDIEEAVSLEGAKLVHELETLIKPLGTTIVALPMLGFLGTILGLIISFQNWEQMGAHVSISQLAGGIYQAMITTAAGLIAAIPYHFIHHYSVHKTETIALDFSQETTQLFRWIKEGLLREVSLSQDTLLNTTS